MKKQMIGLLILALLILLVNCGGGGGGSSSGGSYKTNVEIVLQTTRSASVESGIQKETSQIPAGVVTVRFTISAPDMDTIRREVQVSGRTTIVETFEVPVGPNRRFLIEAIDSAGNVLYQGDVYSTVGGTPLSLSVTMASSDPVAPVFVGLSNIGEITSNSLLLSWSPATDNMTSQNNIQYLIYTSNSPGGENTNSDPSYTTDKGATSYQVTGLSSYTTYYFVVRAKDERGNIDQNMVEKTATTLDGTPPVFAGLSSVTALAENSMQLSWSPATDNRSVSGNIVYLIYMATSSGGQNFSSPNFTTSVGATSYTVTGLDTSTPYFFVVRARDEAGNVDQNILEKMATFPNPPTLSNSDYSIVGLNNCVDPQGGLPYNTFNIGFEYSDINGDANAEAGASLRIQYQFGGVAGRYFEENRTDVLSGINGYSGSIHFDKCIRFDDRPSLVITFTLTDGGNNTSNALDLSINRPEGAN